MKDETLAVLLFIAVFAVLAFGFSAVPFGTHEFLPTGFSIVNDSGNITVNVSDTVSIRLTDDSIDFGNCTLENTRVNIFDSSQANTSTSVDNFRCVNIYSGSYDVLVVENDGNVDVNLTVATNETANDMFKVGSVPSTGSMYAYKMALSFACSTGAQTTYKNMTLASHYYPVCSNFSYVDSQDDIKVYAKVYVNGSASTGGAVKWTFQASSI